MEEEYKEIRSEIIEILCLKEISLEKIKSNIESYDHLESLS
jgi:hypothetical protein